MSQFPHPQLTIDLYSFDAAKVNRLTATTNSASVFPLGIITDKSMVVDDFRVHMSAQGGANKRLHLVAIPSGTAPTYAAAGAIQVTSDSDSTGIDLNATANTIVVASLTSATRRRNCRIPAGYSLYLMTTDGAGAASNPTTGANVAVSIRWRPEAEV